MDASLEGLIILVLIGLSAVFSGMETALVSLSEMRLRKRIDEAIAADKKPSKMLVLWRDKPNDVLATLLIGNNLVNITGSALATHLTERALAGTEFGGWGIPIAVGAMTMLVLIFGEVVPKTYAKHNPERYLRLMPVIRLSYSIFWPFMRILVRLTQRVVGWMGGEIDGKEVVTEDDIEEMVRIGKSDGSIEPVAMKLLTGIFELDDKVAREVMVPRTDMKALPADATHAQIREIVSESGYSRYPVYDGSIDNIVGLLYVKDYLGAAWSGDDDAPPPMLEVLRPPMVRPWNISVRDLFTQMQRERVHMVIIASEYGGVAGILTLEDIIEEVFGPIYDEHDHREDQVREQDDGSWMVEGAITMRELETSLDHDFPDDDDFETVAGLLMKACGAVPEEGFAWEYEGFRFQVRQADATRVIEVQVVRLEPPINADTEPRAAEKATA